MQVNDEMRQAVSSEMVQWASLNLRWDDASRFIGSIAMVQASISDEAAEPEPEAP